MYVYTTHTYVRQTPTQNSNVFYCEEGDIEAGISINFYKIRNIDDIVEIKSSRKK